VWRWFERINRQRSGNGYGPLPISYGELDAFCRVTKTEMEAWEAEAIVMLDFEWRVAYFTKEPQPPKREDDADEAGEEDDE
jgi:hypothetical protein